MAVGDTITRELARKGRSVTLRTKLTAVGPNAWTDGAMTGSYQTLTGFVRQYEPKEVRDAIQSGDHLCVLDGTVPFTVGDSDGIALGSLIADGSAKWWRVVSVREAFVGQRRMVVRLHLRG